MAQGSMAAGSTDAGTTDENEEIAENGVTDIGDAVTSDPAVFDEWMSDADALLWNIEKDPALRSTITALAVLERPPDWDRLVAQVERATRFVPRLRQRVVVPPLRMAPPRWVFDPDFDLEFHLRRVRVPPPGTFDDALRIAEVVGAAAFDRARPLWEFVVVEGLEDGRAVVVQKLHHSITDGVGGIRLAMHLYDLEPEPTDAAQPPSLPDPEPLTLAQLVRWSIDYNRTRSLEMARSMVISGLAGLSGTLAALQQPGTVGGGTVRLARSVGKVLAPVSEPLSPVMRARSLSRRFRALEVPLDDLKTAAKSVDGTLNDAFVAAVTGGLRRYHEQHGHRVDELRMTMPINIRGDDSTAGNRFVPARFPVPVAVVDPAERMRQIGRLVRDWRAEPALALTDVLAGALNRLPTSVTTRVFGSMLKGVDFITSNVPGVPFPVYLAGAPLEAQFAFGPLSGAAVNTVLVSHCGNCCLGVNVDRGAVPDVDRFVDALRGGIEEVVEGVR